ncbi:glycosyltransferase [Patiriisocius hiemis]|uniref:Glycosyltransferase n=1 Tax=Patiriisocius hiemis TaxID=3075604 RepID=A0ABU2YD00_9FLAO|nr:glycosyltransferase [Constantimarinum sp. W242]MDT0556055.1 glycosyltransferase [Constantimarinum sp. W242]
MRVLQLIDSLDGGGAERIAINLANCLSTHTEKSFLCATRKEGILKSTISNKVEYLHLQRNNTLDILSLIRLSKYVRVNKITHIHAHSTSFFLGVLVYFLNRKIKIIWHDHYGDSEHLEKRDFKVLKWFSRYFDCIIAVNEKLKTWSELNLKCNKVYFIINFVNDNQSEVLNEEIKGEGTFKIVCLANVRPQKDHLNLLKAYSIAQKQLSNISLHLIGSVNKESEIYRELSNYIDKHKINQVYFYGSKQITQTFLKQFDIGVLSSRSEGLPVAILEYANAKLPTIVTNVGQCADVIEERGIIVPPQDSKKLAKAIITLYNDGNLQDKFATLQYNFVMKHYSSKSVIPQLIKIYSH